jgi:hypothetical protein
MLGLRCQISGCVLLAIGVWILVDPSKKYLFELIASNTGTSEVLEYLSYALCALGGFVVLVGFFGCCGAMQESKCMLVTVSLNSNFGTLAPNFLYIFSYI